MLSEVGRTNQIERLKESKMIHPETFIVKEDAIRPAGLQDRCFYCNQLLGTEHKSDCVIRERTIVIRATIEYVVDIPEDWDRDQVEFHRNEGSWCSSNFINEMKTLEERIGCLCSLTDFEYIREATEEDEERCGYKGEINEASNQP